MEGVLSDCFLFSRSPPPPPPLRKPQIGARALSDRFLSPRSPPRKHQDGAMALSDSFLFSRSPPHKPQNGSRAPSDSFLFSRSPGKPQIGARFLPDSFLFLRSPHKPANGTGSSGNSASYIPHNSRFSVHNFKFKHLNSCSSKSMSAGAASVADSCLQLHNSSLTSLVKAQTSQRRDTEELWKLLFSDPLQWWDHRICKTNSRYPDFKHKITEEPLWIDNWSTPPWVLSKLATLTPGTIPQNSFSWSVRIARYVKDGESGKALQLFQEMQMQGLKPDKYTFVAILKACASLFALEEGRCIHAQIISIGCDRDIYVLNGLIDMYGKCGNIDDASLLFNSMLEHDVVSWNSMLNSYAKCGYGEKALMCFWQMRREKIEPDAITFPGVLNACTSLINIEAGKEIHHSVTKHGLETDVFIASALIAMYTKFGMPEDAWRIFENVEKRDVVLWNSTILGYLKCTNWNKVWELFQRMQHEGAMPNVATFVGIFHRCAELAALEEGRRAHAIAIKSNWASDLYVGTCLVDMYIKCRRLQDARRVFNNMPVRSIVSWNVMIHGYLQFGLGGRVLELYHQMQQEKVEPNAITMLGSINACASVGALEEGWVLHARVMRSCLEMNLLLSNGLIDMYAKCGSRIDACRVFKNMSKRDLISWNAMLEGYAMYGLVGDALLLFWEMCYIDIPMDDCTFLSLLSALSHCGFVDEGGYIFESITSIYGVQVTVKHYCCMVDLYGRLGLLDEAANMIQTMRYQPDVCVWMVLLNASRLHNNAQMGELAAEQILELDPENESVYVLLSNIYAANAK